jgi:CheY-like chemotaxis protein
VSIPASILLVEDNPGDVRLLKEAFRELNQSNELYTVKDGEEALDFLLGRNKHSNKPCPELVLLDINLPKVSGHQVLRVVKTHPSLRLISVLMLTSSEYEKDIQAAYDHQADGFLRKPVELAQYFEMVEQIEIYRIGLPTAVKASVFWVNTPIHPKQEARAYRRLIRTPMLSSVEMLTVRCAAMNSVTAVTV